MLLSGTNAGLIWKQMDATEPKVYQSEETLTKNCDLINKLTDVVITYDLTDCNRDSRQRYDQKLAHNRLKTVFIHLTKTDRSIYQ